MADRTTVGTRRRRLVAAAAGLVALVVAGGLVQRVAEADESELTVDSPHLINNAQQCPAVFGVVGSSHTDGGYPVSGQVSDDGDRARGTYMDHDNVVDSSWAYYTTRDRHVTLDGGWALGGSTVEALSEKIQPWMFQEGSYVVILAGTVDNMPEHMLSPEESMEHWPQLIEATGVPKDRILVSNLPPMNHLEDNIIAYNEHLEEFTRANGIQLFDLHAVTSDGYRWLPDYTIDGAHFYPDVGALIGQSIADTLGEMSGCIAQDLDRQAQEANLGPATSSVQAGLADGGKMQYFEHGAVVASNVSTIPVRQGILREWEDMQLMDGPLGYPITPAHCEDEQCVQFFQGGRIEYDGTSGTAASEPR